MAVPESWDSEAPCSSCPHARHLSWHPRGPAVLFPLVPEHPAYPCPGRCLLCCDGPAPGVGGDLGNPQPHWVEILRDTSPPVPSHASSISFHFPLSFRSHCLASLPLTPSADLEWMGEGQTRALEGVPWLSLGGGGFRAGDRAQWVLAPPALSLVSSRAWLLPRTRMPGFWSDSGLDPRSAPGQE